MTLKEKRPNYLNYTFIFILIYISFINIFVIKTTPEIIFIQFAILVLIFRKIRFREFSKYWIPFIAFFFIYEFLRGFADNFAPFYNNVLFWVFGLEKSLFGEIPTQVLQKKFPVDHIVTQTSIFFYSIFFYFSFLVGFIIWLKNKKLFKKYAIKFLLLSYISITFFFLIPTAPPWLVNETVDLGIERYLLHNSIFQLFSFLTIWGYLLYGNTVAALPSLHVAWPVFTCFFLLKYFKNRFLYLLLIIPILIGFSVVLTAEHFVIDVLFGAILAVILVFFV
ncbi:hypothetical protein A3G14_02945 [Candidatus Curtissbacteria bacterium RIFCSPLOWO2_12_FULL_38_9]|uniref:Inositolphosphotransferase Aur1/Ipt1 domain-containing protein n=1 Tax=Candidatus Curtissbacteria bacterium RIFCSPLOWO2_12_FULL_38_9 TaxID=1797735 RepID=A0A1F5IAR4_9BACT|nr:MAG: hypothetical protein A3G14_02945 [Candidatus Curtissbacteria bacterium RIFCSPLOWO2_12_FULL_38_9]